MNQFKLLIIVVLIFNFTLHSCRDSNDQLLETPRTKVLSLQPDARAGQDAVIWTEKPDTPIPNSQDFQAMGWTWFAHGFNGGKRRSLINFDLSSISPDAKIVDATLYLYFNPHSAELPSTGGHSQRDGSNRSILSRITSNWSEETVTWNTQPSYSEENQIFVKASDHPEEDYAIDVKNIVEEMIANPEESFGLMYMLENENYYRAMVFASSDNEDSELHPRLVIQYNER